MTGNRKPPNQTFRICNSLPVRTAEAKNLHTLKMKLCEFAQQPDELANSDGSSWDAKKKLSFSHSFSVSVNYINLLGGVKQHQTWLFYCFGINEAVTISTKWRKFQWLVKFILDLILWNLLICTFLLKINK